jgi:oligoendopeptidase F
MGNEVGQTITLTLSSSSNPEHNMKGEQMHPATRIALSFLTIASTSFGQEFTGAPSGQAQDRSKIAEDYKWNLTDIYPNDNAWRSAKDELIKRMPKLETYQGTLAFSSQQLLGCLDTYFSIAEDFSRLYSYASLSSDEDTRDSKYLGMEQEIGQIGTTLAAKSAFIEPEILKIDTATIQTFIAHEKGLEIYKHYLDDIVRRKAHTGTEGEEKIIADAGLMADGPGNIFGIFSDADFPFPEVTLSDGRTVKLDQASFALYRALPNREDRKKVFEAFFDRLNDYRRTFGASLNAEVKKDMFYMNARKYQSCLQAALDANNIPVDVYYSLVKNVNANLATFHRYLELRKRMLGVDTLHYYDLYAPLVPGVDLQYTIDEAKNNVLASLAPLGKEYLDVTKEAFTHRWIDVYPNTGKRSGAYSNGSAYDVHPYILLNYNGKYADMSALAHELGHTMQSYLSNKYQPYVNSQYPIFVAEVASTFNEALLNDYMLKTIKNDSIRLSLLGSYLENIKGTLFRQVQFAEFELRIHERAEKGEPLTGDDLDSIYMNITKKYYGSDEGICVVDDDVKSEWAYIPHFYYDFYVYQYATSFTASQALSEEVLSGGPEVAHRYLQFLSAGCSEYPIDLLRTAGVDMTTSQPFDLTMKKMNRVIDEMEKILTGMGK